MNLSPTKMEKAVLVSLHLYMWLFLGVSGDLWNFISLHFKLMLGRHYVLNLRCQLMSAEVRNH